MNFSSILQKIIQNIFKFSTFLSYILNTLSFRTCEDLSSKQQKMETSDKENVTIPESKC